MSNSQQPATISQHRMVAARPMPRPIPSARRGIEPRRRFARAIRATSAVPSRRRWKIETHGAGAPCEKKKESGASISCRLLAVKWQIRATTSRNWRLAAGGCLLDIADAPKIVFINAIRGLLGGQMIFGASALPLWTAAGDSAKICAMKNDCIFCAIAAGEIPCFKIYEDAESLPISTSIRSPRATRSSYPRRT